MTYVLPTLPHATLSDVSLLQQRGKVNWKLFLMKSGERVFYSVLAISMNCMVIEWTQRFLLISRGKNEFKKSTLILVITFYILVLQFCILNIQYESHVIVLHFVHGTALVICHLNILSGNECHSESARLHIHNFLFLKMSSLLQS